MTKARDLISLLPKLKLNFSDLSDPNIILNSFGLNGRKRITPVYMAEISVSPKAFENNYLWYPSPSRYFWGESRTISESRKEKTFFCHTFGTTKIPSRISDKDPKTSLFYAREREGNSFPKIHSTLIEHILRFQILEERD